MPGVTVRNSCPQASFTKAASSGEQTTPLSPAAFAFCAYFFTVSGIVALMSSSCCIRSSLVEVSCVTASSTPQEPSSFVKPSFAASIMAIVPAACRFVMSTSSFESTFIAFLTVFGMSCSFRSRKILCPRALISRTMSGPSA